MSTNQEVISSLGTTLKVVLGAPATYTQAGFEALTFVEVGELTDIGEFGGESEVLTHTPIKTGFVNKVIGPTDYGTINAQGARAPSDTGQIAMKAGFDGANRGLVHSFEVRYFDGSVEYFTGKITSFTSNIGSASNIRNFGCNVAIDNQVLFFEEDLA